MVFVKGKKGYSPTTAYLIHLTVRKYHVLRNRRRYHLHTGTNTRDQLYTRNQLFIHHNLVQHNTLAPFISLPYHDTTSLHDNHAIFYLRHLMPWYDKRGRGAPLFIELYGSYGFAMCPSSTQCFTKYLTLEFSSCLSSHTNI